MSPFFLFVFFLSNVKNIEDHVHEHFRDRSELGAIFTSDTIYITSSFVLSSNAIFVVADVAISHRMYYLARSSNGDDESFGVLFSFN